MILGKKRGNRGKYIFILYFLFLLISVVLYFNVVGIFIFEGDIWMEVGLFIELY